MTDNEIIKREDFFKLVEQGEAVVSHIAGENAAVLIIRPIDLAKLALKVQELGPHSKNITLPVLEGWLESQRGEDYEKYAQYDIFDAIQNTVDKIVADKYGNDKCPPKFTVSFLCGEEKIILTCEHLGQAYSVTLFPITDPEFPFLEDVIEDLYNNTM